MNNVQQTQRDLAQDKLIAAGRIPYNTATGHYHVAGQETDPRFGGDCRYIAESLSTSLKAIDLDAKEIERTDGSSIDPRRHTAVLVENLPTQEGEKAHFLDARIQMREPLPVYKPGEFKVSAYPVVKGVWTTVIADVKEDGTFKVGLREPFSKDALEPFTFNRLVPLPEQRATPLEVIGKQGRTFIFTVTGLDGGLYQLSYTVYGGKISMKRIGGLGEKNNVERAPLGTDKFKIWMDRVTQASTVSLPEIQGYFDGAAQLHKERKDAQS